MAKKSPWMVTLGVLLLWNAGSQRAPGQEKADERFRSPRATVRTLFTTISLARGAPQFLQKAAACLDLDRRGPQAPNRGGPLATQLEAVLRARDLDSESIPDEVNGDVYLLFETPRIALQRQPDGRWLFDRETVAQIPKLYAEVQKHLQERNREAASLNVSPEHASPRATFRTLVAAFRAQDFERILRCFDLVDIPVVARQELGRQLASKLRQIIVRHHLPVLQEMPDSNYSDPYVWLSQPEGVVELTRHNAGERKGEWTFSRDTVRSIDKLYVVFEDQPYLDEVIAAAATPAGYLPHPWAEPELWLRSQLPAWLRAPVLGTRYLTVQLYEIAGYLLVPALAFGVYRLLLWMLPQWLQRFVARRGWDLPRDTSIRLLRPVGVFAAALVLRWGLLVLGPDRVLLVPLLTVLNPLLWIVGMWMLFRLIDLSTELIELHHAGTKPRPELTQMLWPVSSLALKIGVFVATMFHLMAIFAWDVTAVLTGMGIGGLAFALGAQDSLKNLFGSFTLIADRPFVVGESVKIGNHDVGVVEVVGLRSTRIRTKDDTLLIVPNSSLTTADITNFGRRRYRRYSTRLGIAYGTSPAQLAALRDRILDILRRHPDTRKEQIEVAVNDLAASSIEVLVNVYFDVSERQRELAAREGLIMDILRLAEELHIELAFPTQTIHLVGRMKDEGGRMKEGGPSDSAFILPTSSL